MGIFFGPNMTKLSLVFFKNDIWHKTQLTDHMTFHPPVLLLFFLDKRVTGANAAPISPAREASNGWDALGTIRKPPAAPRDCSRVVEARSGVCFPVRSSDSELGSTRTRPAWSHSELNGISSACPHSFDESPEIIHAHSGPWLDEMCTLCSQRSRARAQCSRTQVQVQRKTLRALARSPQRRVSVPRPRLAPGQCSTSGASAVYNSGAGTMYSSTCSGATQDTAGAGAMFSTTGARAAHPTGAAATCSSSGAGVAYSTGADAMYSSTSAVAVQETAAAGAMSSTMVLALCPRLAPEQCIQQCSSTGSGATDDTSGDGVMFSTTDAAAA